MFIKRFKAKDMPEAIKKIRSEFGPDAIIIDSKPIRNKGIRGLFQKKIVEVVAAYEPDKSKTLGRRDVGKPANETKAVKKKNVQQEKIDQLTKQLENLQDTVAEFSNKIRIANKETTLTFTPEVLGFYNRLLEQDVKEELAKEICVQTQDIGSKKAIEYHSVAKQLVKDRLGEPAPFKLKNFKRNVLMFAGPTGAGKTTTLAKLASMFALDQNLNIGLINMDTYRIGAIEHINIYADIMDIPLMTAYNAEELREAIKVFEDKDVVLIDTAGKTMGDEAYKKEIEEYLKVGEVDEVILVVSATTGNKACKEIFDNFSFVDEYKLIITKLDELSVWGSVLNISDCSKHPPSYITQGQNVPDDIYEADLPEIALSICGQEG